MPYSAHTKLGFSASAPSYAFKVLSVGEHHVRVVNQMDDRRPQRVWKLEHIRIHQFQTKTGVQE